MKRKALFIISPSEARIVNVTDAIDYVYYKKWRWLKKYRVFTKKFDYVITPNLPYTADFSAFFGKIPQFNMRDQELIARLAVFEKKTGWAAKIAYIIGGIVIGVLIATYLIKYGVIRI